MTLREDFAAGEPDHPQVHNDTNTVLNDLSDTVTGLTSAVSALQAPADFITVRSASGDLMELYADINDQLAIRPAQPGTVKPLAPTISVTAGDTVATLSWLPVDGASYYQPYRFPGGTSLPITNISGGTVLGSPIAATATSYIDTGLTNGGSGYTYVVVALNSAGASPVSNAVNVVTASVSTSVPFIAVNSGGEADGSFAADSTTSPSSYLAQGAASEAFFNPGTVLVLGGSVSDTFTGTNGAAPDSSHWRLSSPLAPTAPTIQSNALKVQTAANDVSFVVAQSGGTDLKFQDGDITFTIDVTGVTSQAFPAVVFRSTADNSRSDSYMLLFEITPGSSDYFWSIIRTNSGTETPLMSDQACPSGKSWKAHINVSGSVISASVWASTDSEPGTPQQILTDASALSPAGRVAFGSYGSATSETDSVTYDTVAITGTGGGGDSSLFQSERWSSTGTLEYIAPVPNHLYVLRAYFAEQFTGAQEVGGRVMDVYVQGTVVDHNLDVYALAGAATGLVRSYSVTVTNGLLDLKIVNVSGQSPHISAFSLTPTAVTAVPDAPVLTGTSGDGRGVLNWTSSATASSYQVYDSSNAALGSPTNDTSVTLVLTNGTSPSFTVKAINTIGSSAASNSITLHPAVATSANRGPDPSWSPTIYDYDVLVAPGQLNQTLVNSRPAGTRFGLAAGVHRLSSMLTLGTNQALVGFPGAVVSGGLDISAGWASDGAGRYSRSGPSTSSFSAWTLPDPGGVPILDTNPFGRDVQDVLVDKAFLQPMGSKPASGNTTNFWFDHSNNVIWLGFNPAGHVIETPAFSFNRNTDSSGYSSLVSGVGLILRNLTVEIGGGGWNPLVLLPSGGSIDHCLIRLCHTQGVAGFGAASLTNSQINYNGQMGMSGAIPTVTNTEFCFNNQLFFNSQWEAGGFKYANGVSNAIFTGCLFDHNVRAPGGWFDFAGTGNRFVTCTFSNNGVNGFMNEMTKGSIFDHCEFVGNGSWATTWAPAYNHWWVYTTGIALQHSSGCEIKNCYSHGNYGGPWLAYTDSGRAVGNGVGVPTSNHNVHNNVFGFIGTPNSGIVYDNTFANMLNNTKCGFMTNDPTYPTPTGNTEANNTYYAEPGSAGTGVNWFIFANSQLTFAQTQSAGREASSTFVAGAFPAIPAGVGVGTTTPAASRGVDSSWSPSIYDVLVQPGQFTQALVNSKAAGTIFALAAGVHRLSGNILMLSNQQVLGFPGAIVSGASVLSSWTSDGSGHWYATGITAPPTMNIDAAGVAITSAANPLGQRVQDVYFDKAFLMPVATLGAVTTGKYFYDSSTARVYIGTDPTGHTVETNAFTNLYNVNGDRGIVTFQGTGAVCRNIQFECGGTGWEPFVKMLSGGIMQNCLVRLSHMQGVTGYGATLLNCVITHNGQLGIGGAFALTDNNEISYNNELAFNIGWEAGGGKFANPGTTNTEVRNNWFHHNHGNGFWYDTAGSGQNVHHNTFEYNDVGGFSSEATGPSCQFKNNICRLNGQDQTSLTADFDHWWVYNNGAGIQDSYGWEVSGNYFYGNATGPFLIYTSNNRANASMNNNVHDNYMEFEGTPNGQLVYSTGNGFADMLFNHMTGDVDGYNYGTRGTTNTWTNNHYYAKTGSAGTGGAFFAAGTVGKTFAQWQTLGFDAASTMTAATIPTPPTGVGAPNNP